MATSETAPPVATPPPDASPRPRRAHSRLRATLRRLGGALLGFLAAIVVSGLGLLHLVGLERRFALVLLLLVVGGAVAVQSRVLFRALLLFVLIGSGVLAVVITTPIVNTLVRPLIRRDPIPEAPLDAIVVLSAAIEKDGTLSPPGLDRLRTGAQLLERGVAPRLVLSRVRSGAVTSDSAQLRLLAELGRPVNLTIVDSVHATHDEALRVAELGPSVRRIALVTSPTHTRRACATFEKAGLTVTCVPSASPDLPFGALDAPIHRVPAFREWVYETVGTAVYRARGWVE